MLGVVLTSRRLPVGLDGGCSSCTYFSPSREVCCSSARAFAGSATLPFTLSLTRAYQSCSLIDSTLPTATSFTFTDDWGTRSSTFRNSTVTVYGWLPRLAPPGSGALYRPLNPQPDSSSPAAVSPATTRAHLIALSPGWSAGWHWTCWPIRPPAARGSTAANPAGWRRAWPGR